MRKCHRRRAPVARRGPRPGLLERAIRPEAGQTRNGARQLFSAGPDPGLCSAKKRAAGRRPSLRCGPDGAPHATCRMGTPGCRPAPPPAFGRHEGRGGRGLPNPEPPMLDDLLSHPVPADTDDNAGQSPSPAVHPLDELALYGCRPFQDDADPRPLPEPHAAEGAVAGALNALADLFCGTRLEDDLPDLLWAFVNLFHRKADRITG